MPFPSRLLALLCAVTSLIASPTPIIEGFETAFVKRGDILYEVFHDEATNGTVEFIRNSGVCETTQGVTTVSGYFSVGLDMNMSRNNAHKAPFAAWFNGGPGCSSMIGLFQENGPCHFTGSETEPTLNPYSWSEYAHMLYVDQPIGVGFSYGTDAVNSTVTAAPYIWALLQAFFKMYPKFLSRDFSIFTESYGGHYGPEFASYIESQNAAIAEGTVAGDHIELVALGVNNGFYDALIQYPAYITYSLDNKYKQILNQTQANMYSRKYKKGCEPLLKTCTSIDIHTQIAKCTFSSEYCYEEIERPIYEAADFDVYDVREPANDPYPPNNYVTYLNRPDIQKRIGVNNITFVDCSDEVYSGFAATGDDSRPFLETLSEVVQSGIQILLWAGDADWICNYMGGFAVVNSITYPDTKSFVAKKLSPYKVKGKQKGLFKTVSNLSWLQVFEAGHEVAYYQPQLALQVFRQTLEKKPIFST